METAVEPERLEFGTLTTVRKDDLKQRLTAAGIPFDETANRIQLQALCALLQQKLLKSGDRPNQELLRKVVDWIGKPASELKQGLKKRNLDATGYKWDHIEVLITAE